MTNSDANNDVVLRGVLADALAPPPLTDDQIEAALNDDATAALSSEQIARISDGTRRLMARTAGAANIDDVKVSARATHETAATAELPDQKEPVMKRLPASETPHRASRGSVAAVLLSAVCLTIALVRTTAPPVESRSSAAPGVHLSDDRLASASAYLMAKALTPVEEMRADVGDVLTTARAEKRRIRLPDESTLYLNAETTARIVGPRRIALEQGEVYVEVAQQNHAADAGAQFELVASDHRITAEGTRFSVSADSESTGVLVTQGRVHVDDRTTPLVSGQMLNLPAASDSGRGVSGGGEALLTSAPRPSAHLDWTRELMQLPGERLVAASDFAGGALVTVDPQGQSSRLSLRKYHIDVHVEDGFARTTIDQTYFNHTSSRLEGTFHFPLPADASLSRLAMYVNGKLMEGGMAERNHARNTFEQIVHKMQDPALLEWVDGTLFKMRVFPLEPRQEKRIVLSYTQRLPAQYDKISYRFPAGHSLDVVRDWSTRIQVVGAESAQWNSPSHALEAETAAGDLILTGTLHNATFDRDLVVEFSEETSSPAASRPAEFAGTVHDDNRYVMLRYRPDLPGEMQRRPHHWMVLFEASGDRNPLLARTQVEFVRTLLQNAEQTDTFQVVTATTRPRSLFDGSRTCSAENIAGAMTALEKTHLVGALDLAAAFEHCSREVPESSPSAGTPILVHVGGGLPALGQQSADELRQLLPPQAAYIGVGVGRRWNRALMKSLAEATGGWFTQLNPDENVPWRSFEVFSTLHAPRLQQIKVHIEDGETDAANSPVQFHLFEEMVAQGEEIVAVCRLPEDTTLPEVVTISATRDGEPWQQNVSVRDVREGADYLPRMWARLEIERLLAENAAEHRERIVALSKSMYVMSPFTSLLVLENEEMYAQFGIDGGREDHWALYPCPDEIEVVQESATELPGESLARMSDGTQSRGAAADALDSLRVLPPAQWQQQSPQHTVQGLIEYEIDPDTLRKLWGVPSPGYVNERHLYFKYAPPASSLNLYDATIPHFAVPDLRDDQSLIRGSVGSGVSFQNDKDFFSTDAVGLFPRVYSIDQTIRFTRPELNFATNSLDSPVWLNANGSWEFESRQRATQKYGFGRPPLSRLSTYDSWLPPGSEETRWLLNLGRSPVSEVELRQLRSGNDDFSLPVTSFTVTTDTSVPATDLLRILGESQFNDPRLPGLEAFRSAGTLVDQFGESKLAEIEATLLQDVDSLSALPRQRSTMLSGIPLREQPRELQLGVLDANDGINPARLSWRQINTRFDEDWGVWFDPHPGLHESRRFRGRTSTTRDNPEQSSPHSGRHRWAASKTPGNVSGIQLPPCYNVSAMQYGSGYELFGDLMSYAPGLNTSRADVSAVLDDVLRRGLPLQSSGTADDGDDGSAARDAGTLQTATAQASELRIGRVDAAAKELVASARSRGWESITLSSHDGQPGVTVHYNGTGQHVWTRTLSEGLHERVVCDGKALWHMYPDIGLASKRVFSRFHHHQLQRLIPWLLPAVHDLALNYDVVAIDDHTVELRPIRRPILRPQAAADSARTARDSETPNESDDADDVVERLLFAENGRLAERQFRRSSGAVLLRLRFTAAGVVTATDAAGDQLARHELHRATSVPQHLDPELGDLVCLPMPIRLPGSSTNAASEEADVDYAELREDEALSMVLADLATGNPDRVLDVLRQRFLDQGDQRDGLYVLLSRLPRKLVFTEQAEGTEGLVRDVDLRPDVEGSPLRQFVRQQINWVRDGNDAAEFELDGVQSGFLYRLATGRNLYLRWKSGRAVSDRTEAQVRSEMAEALSYVSECRTAALGWAVLSVMEPHLQSDQARRDFSEAVQRYESNPLLSGLARLTRVRALFAAGEAAEARELFNEWHRWMLRQGVVPALAEDIRSAYRADEGVREWEQHFRSTVDSLADDGSCISALMLTAQLRQLGDSQLADEGIDRVLRKIPVSRSPYASLLLVDQMKQQRDPRADELLSRVTREVPLLNEVPTILRYAAAVADEAGSRRQALARLERAILLEFETRPTVINIETVNQDYADLMRRFEELVDAILLAEADVPADLPARIVRAADQWRALVDDDTAACEAASRIFSRLRQTELAWDYLTTPLAENSGESGPWKSLAETLGSDGRIDLADLSWTRAFELESTNPDLLLAHARLLHEHHRRDRARQLAQQIVDGDWQPRFSRTVQHARELLQQL